MALHEDGRAVGSVSGGCIEDDLIHRYTFSREDGGFPEEATQVLRYGVSADEAHRFGLPCGGSLELVLEFQMTHAMLDQLVSVLEKGRLVRRTVLLEDGSVELETCKTPDALYFDGHRLINTLGPGYRMLLIGAGALAEYVATMALFNGFSVTVCDPRTEHTSTWSVPNVVLLSQMPDDAVMAFTPDLRSCVIALSHDPKLDDLALLIALDTPAFYIGAIGSRRNNLARRKRLIDHFGQTEQSLEKLRGPIGIYIASKTPAEIAVSVMAEVLAIKNGVCLSPDLSVANAKERLETA